MALGYNVETFEGVAALYCEGKFRSLDGKTAHGLVRFCERYQVAGVIDSTCAGFDAGELLNGRKCGIPVCAGLDDLREVQQRKGAPLTHFVIALAPSGGRLQETDRASVMRAIELGLHVDSGLHFFLGEDPEFCRAARERGVTIRDVRRCPPQHELHFFSGKIREVTSCRVAVLGTDCAVGKRTTCWELVRGLRAADMPAELIGTGQTAWFQGARYGTRVDAVVYDYVGGELEHAAWSAWRDLNPDVLVVEGQGGLMSPGYPGGIEIINAVMPDVIILQHAPGRACYEDYPDFPIQPIETQITALELVSGKPVAAVTISSEGLADRAVSEVCLSLSQRVNRPVFDVLSQGVEGLVQLLAPTVAACRCKKDLPGVVNESIPAKQD